jgi:plasmid stabilization system protein ParE
MARYRISEAAAADLDAIMAGIRLLADHPRMGRARGELAPGLRGFPTPDYLDYLIFYRRARGYIDIVRVLHGSQHLPASLRTESILDGNATLSVVEL